MRKRELRAFCAALFCAVMLAACGQMKPIERAGDVQGTLYVPGVSRQRVIDESLAATYDLPYEKGTYINTGHILYRPTDFRFYRTWEAAGVSLSDLPGGMETTEYIPIRIGELEEWKEKYGDFPEWQQKEWDALHEDPPWHISVLLMTVEVTNLDLPEEDLENDVIRLNDGLNLLPRDILENRNATASDYGVTQMSYCDLGNEPNSSGYYYFSDFPEIGETAEVTVGFKIDIRQEEALRNGTLCMIYTLASPDYGVAETCKMTIPTEEVLFDAE